jgi:very-short-patch-repair endonuclease
MNLEYKTTNSSLEEKFKTVLIEKNIKYTKEKKHDYCSLDFFADPNVIFEVNGPHHYFDYMFRAKDIQKYRILSLQNYEVFDVSYSELDNPENIEDLKKRLDDVVTVLKADEEIAA